MSFHHPHLVTRRDMLLAPARCLRGRSSHGWRALRGAIRACS